MGSFIGRFKDQHIESSDDEFENAEKGKAALVGEKQKPKWWHLRARLRGGQKKKKPVKGGGGAYLFLQYLNSVPVHLHGPDGPAKDMLVLQIKGGKNPGNLEALGKEGLESMYMVDMQKIGLIDIPKGIDGAQQLRVAQFSWNNISHVDVLIAKIDTLTNLILDHNKIQKISPKIFDGKKFKCLKVMNLSYNQLDVLPMDFGKGMESLEYLDLSHNVLTELPDNMCICKALKSLFCTHNSLQTLPADMGELTSLERVFVSFNKLTAMPATLANCENIERIRVIGNQLRELPVEWISLLQADKWKEAFSGEEPPSRSEFAPKPGKLVELLVERNPLVRPPITAFDEVVGGLGNAFRLFYEEAKYPRRDSKARMSLGDGEGEQLEGEQDLVDSALPQLEDRRQSVKVASVDDLNPLDSAQMLADKERHAYETYYLSKFVLDEDGEKVHDADGNEIIEPVPETEKALIRSIQSTMLFRKRTQTIDELAASGIKDTTDNSDILASDFDMQFCLFVCATKEQFKTASTLFDKIESQGNEFEGKPYVTPTEWHHYCSRAPLRLEHDVQIRMWDLMAVNNGAHLDRVFVHDFIAAWMIHDLEYKDLWIDRITKVLRLKYYQLAIEDMTSKVYAKLRSSADHAERYNAPPVLEGERIVKRLDEPVKSKSQGHADEAELNGAAPKANVFVPADDKQVEEDEDAIVSDLEVDSSDLSDSEDTKGSDEELKALEWVTDKRQELGSEAEDEMHKNAGPSGGHERIDMSTIAGFHQLMAKPVNFFRQLGKETDHHGDTTHAPLAKAVTQKKKKKSAAKDPRFSTDMLEVRIALRNAFRAMSPQTFTLLVNWLVRTMRNMQSAARPQQMYLHVDDPVYRMLVQRKEVEALLETLGFVELNSWWVWPRLHLPYACPPIDRDARGASWGMGKVHTGCLGTHKDRLDDCVVLLRACQQEMQNRKAAGTFHGTFK